MEACHKCGGPLTTGGCMRCSILKDGIPLVLGTPAGTCGKCGAPYFQDTYTGALRPICVCWNLPKITYSDNAGKQND